MDQHLHILILANRNPFFMERILSGMGAFALEQGGWSFDVVDRGDAWRKRDLRRDVAGAGAIVTVGLEAEGLDRVIELDLPAASIHTSDPRLPSVQVDDAAIGRLAGEYLLDRGFERFAYYGPERDASIARIQAFGSAICAHGCKPPTSNLSVVGRTDDWDELQNRDVIARWLESLELPTAVLAFNDQLGALILEVCEARGIAVPDDLAVIGVDNTELRCEYRRTPLSSIDPDIPRLGYEAARLVGAMIRGEQVRPCVRRVAPLGVVTRKSTDTLVTADPEVRRAATIIRDRACDGLDYEQLMESFSISRRTLERRFRAELGRSIGDQIRRVRLSRARELLGRTEMPLADIAARTGFEYMSYLSRAFKKAYGENPSAYRARSRRR